MDIYLLKAEITGGKRKNDPYYDEIKKHQLRDNASIKKIAKCWAELPKFQQEFARYVLREIQPDDIKINNLTNKIDTNVLRECYILMLYGLKKALDYLEKENLTNEYELAHFWPKVEFKKKDYEKTPKRNLKKKKNDS